MVWCAARGAERAAGCTRQLARLSERGAAGCHQCQQRCLDGPARKLPRRRRLQGSNGTRSAPRRRPRHPWWLHTASISAGSVSTRKLVESTARWPRGPVAARAGGGPHRGLRQVQLCVRGAAEPPGVAVRPPAAPAASRPARGSSKATASVAQGESVIKCPSPQNVLKGAYDHSCFLAQHVHMNIIT